MSAVARRPLRAVQLVARRRPKASARARFRRGEFVIAYGHLGMVTRVERRQGRFAYVVLLGDGQEYIPKPDEIAKEPQPRRHIRRTS